MSKQDTWNAMIRPADLVRDCSTCRFVDMNRFRKAGCPFEVNVIDEEHNMDEDFAKCKSFFAHGITTKYEHFIVSDYWEWDGKK